MLSVGNFNLFCIYIHIENVKLCRVYCVCVKFKLQPNGKVKGVIKKYIVEKQYSHLYIRKNVL